MPRSARALVVELVADTKDFVKGTQDADKALAKMTSPSSAGIRGLENLEKKSQETAREIAHGKTKEAFGEAGSEVGGEFAQNLGSSLSSGDLTTIAQDTAGGLVGAFAQMGGPIGLAFAGIATVATGVFANMQKKAADTAERIATIFDKQTENAQKAMDDNLRLSALKQRWEQMFGTVQKGWDKMSSQAGAAGVNMTAVMTAIKNGGTPLKQMTALLGQIEEQGTTISHDHNQIRVNMTGQAKAAKELSGWITQTSKDVDTATASSQSMESTFANLAADSAIVAKNMKSTYESARGVQRVAGTPGGKLLRP